MAVSTALYASAAGKSPRASIASEYVRARQNGQDQVTLVIAATTDVHGRIRGWDYYQNMSDGAHSLAAAATIVDSIRRENSGRVVLVDAGDLLQGNPLTYVAAKVSKPPVNPVIAAMNVMKYDAAVIGNHEFNYGLPLLRVALTQARFPFLGANVRANVALGAVLPYTMLERAGVRIGIIGATTPGSMVWDRENLQSGRVTVTDILPAVSKGVLDARRAGANVVVVLLHSGLDEAASYDTIATGLPSENVAARVALEIPGIDLIVFGHSHRELVDSVVNGTLLVQPRNWAASVAVASLTLVRNREGLRRSWRVVSRKGRSVLIAGHREALDVLAASAATHRETVAWATTPIGHTEFFWRSDSARVADMPITDFVNETMRRKSGADLSATAAFSTEASLGPGAITVADISRLYPYDNTLRVVRISGDQLKSFLEFSSRYFHTIPADGSLPANGVIDKAVPGYNFDVLAGAEYTIDLRRGLGERITKLEVKGRVVLPTDTFTLALNNYRQNGGGGYGMLSGATVVYEREVDIRQLLIDEVTRTGNISPQNYSTRNWNIVPESAAIAAYEEMKIERTGSSTEQTKKELKR